MATSNVKSRLSRKYVYARLADLNVDLTQAEIKRIAFMDDPTVEPDDQGDDWKEAIVVTSGHDLFKAEIGPAIAALAGPLRGDTLSGEETTVDLALGKHMVWTDWKMPNSNERETDWHGPIDVRVAPGSF